MTLVAAFVALLALMLLIAALVRSVAHDGLGERPGPASHDTDEFGVAAPR